MDKQIKAEIGSTISFGGYDWRVLDVQDGKALLLSDKAIETRAYHRTYGVLTWAECDLRNYLNGEFYDSLGEDRARIATTEIRTRSNPWYGINGGASTDDKIFLLSIEEVVKYFGDSGQLKNRPDDTWRISDEYDPARVITGECGKALSWWLRSPGCMSANAVHVGRDGHVCIQGLIVSCPTTGVRTALWLNLQHNDSDRIKAVALINDSYVRDAQVLTDDPRAVEDYYGDDSNWSDYCGSFFIGIYEGTEAEIREKAAAYAGVHPNAVNVVGI